MNRHTNRHSKFPRWWLTIFLLFCAATFAANQVIEPLYKDGFEELPFQLDCERLNYPCSLAEADPDALTRALALLDELWGIRDGGTLDDCYDHLTNQSDVQLIFRGEHSLSFQVEGMMPVVFHEIPPPPDEPLVQTALNGDPLSTLTSQAGPATVLSQNSGGSPVKSKNPGGSRPQRVVGEDLNEDGIIDQRDGKTAWLLSPYEYLPPFVLSSSEIAATLREIPDYGGNATGDVTVVQNLSDTDYLVDDKFWFHLKVPDLLVISTFTGWGRILTGGGEEFGWISTGILASNALIEAYSDPYFSVEGWTLGVHYFENEAEPSSILRRFVIGRDFVSREVDHAGSDKLQLMVFLRDPVPPQFNGYFRHVPRHQSVSFQPQRLTLSESRAVLQNFFRFLATGVNVNSGVRGDQNNWFSQYSGSGDDARIKELPRLMLDGLEAPLGFPLAAYITGEVGDQANDNLKLTVQIDGVTDEDRDNFAIRYRIAGQAVPGAHNLASASKVPGNNFRWEVEHDLDLGFPLQSGGLVPIEIIVELPEGGESRYTGWGSLADCWFYARLSGDVAGSFAGPAGFNFDNNGKLSFEFKEVGWFWVGVGLGTRESWVNTDLLDLPSPLEPVEPSSAALASSWGYRYQPQLGEDFTCETCGGILQLTDISGGDWVSGTAAIRLIRPPVGSDPPGYEPAVDLFLNFRAARGNLLQGKYLRCSATYDP